MGMISEFRQFIQRGNVMDMAVGVIMGAAFGKIVNSVVADVIMPPIGYLIGGVNFRELKYTLPKIGVPVPNPEKPGEMMTATLPETAITYGNFLQTTFDFLIIAFCIFLLIKGMNRLNAKKAEEPPKPAEMPPQEKLLMEIRDLLKAQSE